MLIGRHITLLCTSRSGVLAPGEPLSLKKCLALLKIKPRQTIHGRLIHCILPADMSCRFGLAMNLTELLFGSSSSLILWRIIVFIGWSSTDSMNAVEAAFTAECVQWRNSITLSILSWCSIRSIGSKQSRRTVPDKARL